MIGSNACNQAPIWDGLFVVSHMTRKLNTPNAAEYATKVPILNDIFHKLVGQQHPHIFTLTQSVANNASDLISKDGVHPTHRSYAFIASFVHSAVRNHLAHKFYPAAATSFVFTQPAPPTLTASRRMGL